MTDILFTFDEGNSVGIRWDRDTGNFYLELSSYQSPWIKTFLLGDLRQLKNFQDLIDYTMRCVNKKKRNH